VAPPAEKVLPAQGMHVPFDRPWPAVQPVGSKGRAGVYGCGMTAVGAPPEWILSTQLHRAAAHRERRR